MAVSPEYKLTLHKTYYDKGFFNLGVEIERFVRPSSGPIKILLGYSKEQINGRVDREANQNGTPRAFDFFERPGVRQVSDLNCPKMGSRRLTE